MKTPILFTRFPYESAYGGEEKVHVQMAKIFSEQGNTPLFFGSCPIMAKIFEEENFFSVRFPFFRDITAKFSVLFSIFTLGVFFLLGVFVLLFFRFHHGTKKIICMTYIEKIIWTPIALLFGYQVFWAHHAPLGQWFFQNPYRGVWKFFSAKVTIITPSKFLQHQLQDFLELSPNDTKNFSYIYNPIEIEELDNSKKIEKKKTRITIGTASRLSPEKNIAAVIELAKNFSTVHFCIAGTGPEEKFLKDLAYHQDNIEFMGFRDPKDMKKFFRTLDLFILPSLEEPFGLVAGEAMLSSVPVLVSDIGGIREVVGEYGEYFDPLTKGDFEYQVKKFLLKKDEDIRKDVLSAKTHIEEKFSLSVFQKRLEKVIEL